MHPFMSNVPPRHHAEIHDLEKKPASKLNRIHLQLAIVYYGNGPSMSMCIPNPTMTTMDTSVIGTINCNQGNCDDNCLLYYSTRFGKVLKLLEDLECYAIEIKKAIPQNAPEPCKCR